VAALERLVLAVEVERYAPRPLEVSADVLRDDALTCVAALRNGVSERSRRRADWLPSSLRRGGLPGVRPGPGDVESRDRDQVIEHVGR